MGQGVFSWLSSAASLLDVTESHWSFKGHMTCLTKVFKLLLITSKSFRFSYVVVIMEVKCKCFAAGGQNLHLACFNADVPQKQHFLLSLCNSQPCLAYPAAPPLLLLSGDIRL